jgi:uncharacterized protein YecE (DUF72 family)
VPRIFGLRDALHLTVATAYIGTSGWVYAGWREHLYADTPTKKWLQVASHAFDALEINGSFYSQLKPETYQRWYDETPAQFRFALKGHRFVTHYKRLGDCEDSIIRLRDQAAPLKEKLGAVVWQLPSNYALDMERLESFMRAVKAWPSVRHALELRHRSWFVPEVSELLRANNVAVCMGDAPDFPMWREVTADLVYVRLHGHTRKYASSYSEQSLRTWADDAKQWLAEGRDVHVYFDNDAEGHAVRNALRFQEIVHGTAPRMTSIKQKLAEFAPRARRVAARSTLASSADAHASPSRRPNARPGSRASSARRSTARTESRARRPSGR